MVSSDGSTLCGSIPGEPTKILPVLFIVAIICLLYTIYMSHHALPLLWDPTSPERRARGLWDTVIFNSVTAMLWICYVRCVFTHPGSVPDSTQDPNWTFTQQTRDVLHTTADGTTVTMQEAKKTGDRRHCKWCAKYKPDRCHHCRVCRTCVLKMDHHCPWIYNCVGYQNHKSFFLLLVYSCIALHRISWTMIGTVQGSLDNTTPFTEMFLLLFGETLACFLCAISSCFLLFHIWLMMRGLTTIEFCEKSMRRSGYDTSTYDRGTWANLCAVLGDDPWLWPFPLGRPSGSGLEFITEETPIAKTGAKKKKTRGPRDPPSRYRSSRSPPATGGTDSALCSDTGGDSGAETSSALISSGLSTPGQPDARLPVPTVSRWLSAGTGTGRSSSPAQIVTRWFSGPAGSAALHLPRPAVGRE